MRIVAATPLQLMITPLNIDPEQAQLRRRLHTLSILIALCFMALLARLIWLQIIEHDHFSAQADSNRIAHEPLVAARVLQRSTASR